MKKQIITLFAAVLAAIFVNIIAGAAIATVLGFSIITGAVAFVSYGVVINIVKHVTGQQEVKGLALAGLAKEIWLAELMKKLRFDTGFFSRARDLSAYVNNDVINFTEAGADPGVIEDYDHVDPLAVADDEDTPKTVSLKSFSTERSKITASAQQTRAYSIMTDRMERHATTLMQAMAKYAAYQWAPSANGTYTPIIRTSGATANSRKKITLQDVLDFEKALNNLDCPGNRIMVFNPTDLGDLKAEDKNLFKSFTPDQMQQGFPLFSLTCYVTTATPRYATDGAPARKAWSAANEDTDLLSSFGFIENEVCRAGGSIEVFKTLATAEFQADFISTRAAFIAATMRGKYVGAIVAKSA